MTAYTQSARIYDALCRHKDYRRAAAAVTRVVRRTVPQARTLLDVGCGTGRHLEHLLERFRVEGLDRSPDMLAIARKRCPGVPLHVGSLVNFNLRRQYDVIVCLFGALAYAKTRNCLQRSARCMARHLRRGGVLVVEPWIAPEKFVEGRLVFDRVDDPDLKVARMYVTSRQGTVSIFDSRYVVATPAGVEHFGERQELGLFTDREYRTVFRHAGLAVVATAPDLFGYGLYVCQHTGDVTRTGTRRRRSS